MMAATKRSDLYVSNYSMWKQKSIFSVDRIDTKEVAGEKADTVSSDQCGNGTLGKRAKFRQRTGIIHCGSGMGEQ